MGPDRTGIEPGAAGPAWSSLAGPPPALALVAPRVDASIDVPVAVTR